MAELKPSEKLFAEAYVANSNATQAYKIISPNACDVSARSGGSRLLQKPEIRAYIIQLYEEYFGEYKILAFRTLSELETVAFAEKGDKHYNAAAKLKAIELIQKQLGLQTKNVNVESKTEVEINILSTKDEAET